MFNLWHGKLIKNFPLSCGPKLMADFFEKMAVDFLRDLAIVTVWLE